MPHSSHSCDMTRPKKEAFILCFAVASVATFFFPLRSVPSNMPVHMAIYHKRQQLQSNRHKWIDSTWKIVLAICWNCIIFLWANSMDAKRKKKSIIKKAFSYLSFLLSTFLHNFGATTTNLKSSFLLLAFIFFPR